MRLLQAKDVAAILSCSESHVYQLDRRGLLPASYEWPCKQSHRDKKRKKMKRWVQADIEAFLAKFKKSHTSEIRGGKEGESG